MEMKAIPKGHSTAPNGSREIELEMKGRLRGTLLSVAAPQHGEFVYCHGRGQLLRVWLRTDRQDTLEFWMPPVDKVADSAAWRHKVLLSCGADGTRLVVAYKHVVWVWNLEDEAMLAMLETTSPEHDPNASAPDIQQALLTPAGDRVIAYGSLEGGVKVLVWDLASASLETTWTPNPSCLKATKDITALCTSGDGRFIATGVTDGAFLPNPKENCVCIYDIEEQRAVATSLPGEAMITAACSLPGCARRVCTSDAHHTVRVWDVEDLECIASLETPGQDHSSHGYHHVLLPSPDGRFLAAAFAVDAAHIWDTQRLECVQRLPCKPTAWAADSRHLFTNVDKTLVRFSMGIQEAERTRYFHLKNKAKSMCPTHDGSRLVVAQATALELFDVASGVTLADMSFPDGAELRRALCVTPTDSHVACSADTRIAIFQLRHPYTRQASLALDNEAVAAMTFTQDGHYLAAGTDRGHLHIWDVKDIMQPQHLACVVAEPDAGQPQNDETMSARALANKMRVVGVCALPTASRILTRGQAAKLRIWAIGDEARQPKEEEKEREGEEKKKKGEENEQQEQQQQHQQQQQQQQQHHHQNRHPGVRCVDTLETETSGGNAMAYRVSDKLVGILCRDAVEIYSVSERKTLCTADVRLGKRDIVFPPRGDAALAATLASFSLVHFDGKTEKMHVGSNVDTLAMNSQQQRLFLACARVVAVAPVAPLFDRRRVPCRYERLGVVMQHDMQTAWNESGAGSPQEIQRPDLETVVPADDLRSLSHRAQRNSGVSVSTENMTMLAWLASSGERLHHLTRVLENVTPGVLDLLSEPSFPNAAITRSKDEAMIAFVARTLASAARAADKHQRTPGSWTLHIGTLNSAFTRDVILLIRHFPTVAAQFLDSLGLVKTLADKDYNHQETRLPSSQMVVVAHNSVDSDELLWKQLRVSGELAGLEDSNAAPTLTEARVVPIPHAAGFLPDGTSFLEALVGTGGAELFSSYIARAVVQFKWQTSGRRKFVAEALWYILTVALITALTFVFNTDGADVAQLVRSDSNKVSAQHGSDVTSVVLLLLLALMAGWDLVQEVRQSFLIASYWGDFWNWLDITNALLVFVVLGTYFGGWAHARAFLAIAVYLRWYGLLYYLQPFQSTGPLVRMILAICYDMRYFLLVLGISIVAAWTSFRLLLLDDSSLPLEGLGDPANGLLVMFNMLLLADFELDTFDGDYVVLLRILFVLSMVLVPVVLLNLLIALMSDSYERIQDRADIEFQLLRAKILVEQEAWLSKEERENADLKQYPVWLHVLVPKGTGVGRDESGTQWQGVLHALKKEMADKIKGSETKTTEQLRSVERKVEGMEKQLAGVRNDTTKVLNLLQQLTNQQQQAPEEAEGFLA